MNCLGPEEREGRQQEHAGTRETGLDQAVSVKRDDESRGA